MAVAMIVGSCFQSSDEEISISVLCFCQSARAAIPLQN
jgi:hypothetical protein